MGSRAQYAVVQDGKAELYYSHWGAVRIPEDVFWGPATALALFRLAEKTDTLLDEVWCEGAALVDCDKKLLLFWGGDSIAGSPGLRDMLFRLMRHLWPGWTLRWANRGIYDIADHLALRASRPDSGEEDPGPKPAPLDSLKKVPDRECSVVTVRGAAGLRDFAFHRWGGSDLPSVLAWGPGLLGILDQVPEARVLTEKGVVAGAFVDEPRGELSYWWGDPTREVWSRVAEAWAGWTVREHFGGLPRQFELSGRDPDLVRLKDEDTLRGIASILFADQTFDPRELLNSLSRANPGQNLRVNPHFLVNPASPVTKDERLTLWINALRDLTGRDSTGE